MSIETLPDDKLKELLEKYVEKNTRYKFFVNEETERSEKKVLEINNEMKRREEFRNTIKEKRVKYDNE